MPENDLAWEINEAWLQIAIAQELHRAARRPGLPPWRIHDEYPESGITNVLSEDSHPIDIVVFYPLASGNDPWSHCACLGAIEIKKGWGNLKGDAKRLARLAIPPTQPDADAPLLKWVMLVTLINGPSADAVLTNDERVKREVDQFGLKSLLPCDPIHPSNVHSEVSAVIDRWFDVVCYGKEN